MKKYGMTVKSLHIGNEIVVVGLSVHSCEMPSIPLFNLGIDVERKEDLSISAYESLALKEAASLINRIAKNLVCACEAAHTQAADAKSLDKSKDAILDWASNLKSV